jgi:hypothetical protein
MKPASRKKTRKSRTSSGNPVTPKKEAPFFHPQEGGEHSFFQPQANALPGNVQAKMETTMGEDFSGVQIHENSAAATQMHALAFTQGENIHFAPGQYDPGTRSGQELIGHELAHVRQQRQGRVSASLKLKGRNVNTDSSLEAEADAMGRRAAGAAGQGSAALGLRRSMSGKAASGVAQMKKPPVVLTDFGKFHADTYENIGNYGAQIKLAFKPNIKVEATKIALVQTVKEQTNGNINLFSPTTANRSTADGTSIDRKDSQNNPVYGAQILPDAQGLDKTPENNATSGNNYQLGFRKKDQSGSWTVGDAWLDDSPFQLARGNDSFQRFETAAFALEGAQKGMYYGSVNWGWEVSKAGSYRILPLSLAGKGDLPTPVFLEAAQKWNDNRAMGTIKTAGNPTRVYDALSLSVKDTLTQDTPVNLTDNKLVRGGISYNGVTYSSPTKTGVVKTSDLKDMGGGLGTVNLPVPWSATVKVAHAFLREGQDDNSTKMGEMTRGAQLTVLSDTGTWLRVHLDPSQRGVIVYHRRGVDVANLLNGFIHKDLIRK